MDDRHGEYMKAITEEEFLKSDKVQSLAELFKAMADPTRLKILYVLSNEDLCVQDIANRIDMSQSSVSHQLKSLRMLRLVKFERSGKQMIYSLDDDHVYKLFNQGLEHILHE
ncbi:MAG: metalloregulator ArsR/SmtB family transcription factor [Tissierellia bacterium]|nr:metalloregulator ArsR/SmtB family transcription factor [Tissierellia bacterium]